MALTLEANAATERAITRLYQNAAMGRADKVQRLDGRRYVITSGTSGNQYLVNCALSTCDCTAGQFGRLCRHKIAAQTVEQALQKITSAPSTPEAPVRPLRPAHVPERLWNRLSGSERRDVADGRMWFEAIAHTNRWNTYLEGYLIGTIRA